MYYNEEVYELRKKAIVCAIVFVIVMVVGLLFIFNRFGVNKNVILEAIKKEESFIVLFNDRSKNCSKCDMVKERLDTAGVTYYDFNIRGDGVEAVLEKLKVSFTIYAPTVFVIKDGKMAYNIVNIKDQQTIDTFIKYNKLAEFGE